MCDTHRIPAITRTNKSTPEFSVPSGVLRFLGSPVARILIGSFNAVDCSPTAMDLMGVFPNHLFFPCGYNRPRPFSSMCRRVQWEYTSVFFSICIPAQNLNKEPEGPLDMSTNRLKNRETETRVSVARGLWQFRVLQPRVTNTRC